MRAARESGLEFFSSQWEGIEGRACDGRHPFSYHFLFRLICAYPC